MTFKEFVKTSHGIKGWQVCILSYTDPRWSFGTEEELVERYGDSKVVNFYLTTRINRDIICSVDVI
jgi:ribosomal 30S subunit maturation factor RimM